MGSQRAHIVLPQDLLREIDAMVGPRGRSAFLVETARAALRQKRLLRFLESEAPAWKTEDHPELVEGVSAWVQGLRREGESRVPSSESTA